MIIGGILSLKIVNNSSISVSFVVIKFHLTKFHDLSYWRKL